MSDSNGSGAKPDVAALRAEIKQTRSELGETVQALAARADVKARAREQVEHTKERVKAQAAEAGGRFRDAALGATGRVRAAAAQATGTVREAGPRELVYDAGARVRRNPMPAALALAGLAAVLGIILVVRGRRA